MLLEAENRKALHNPDPELLIEYLFDLDPGGNSSFAYLTRDDGSYVQAAGGGTACVLKWRDIAHARHNRAYRLDLANQADQSIAVLYSGAEIQVSANERHRIETVVEAFLAFLAGQPFPLTLGWRDIGADLGLDV